MAIGQVFHEVEVGVPASVAWDLYGSLKLAKIIAEALPELIQKFEVVQGDGGAGTVLRLTFPSGGGGPSGQTEKFTKVDGENRVKEVEAIEGGLLDFGLSLYRVRFEIIDNSTADSPDSSCIIKSSIDYDVVKEEDAANAASFVTIEPFAKIAEFAKKQLLLSINN